MTNRKKYNAHKYTAIERSVPFLLTFEQWWKIWQDSGHWEERGRKRGQYCMARFGDVGPYAVNNVRICLISENHGERGPPFGNKSKTGKIVSKQTCEKLKSSVKAYWERRKRELKSENLGHKHGTKPHIKSSNLVTTREKRTHRRRGHKHVRN